MRVNIRVRNESAIELAAYQKACLVDLHVDREVRLSFLRGPCLGRSVPTAPGLPGRKTLALGANHRQSLFSEALTRRKVVAMFKSIVLAVDTSEHSRKAVETAASLATSVGAEVHVLHVRPLVSTGRGGLQDLDLTEEGHNVAEEVCHELQAKGIETTFSRIASYHGDAGSVIVEAARERGADLIVVGTRGHSQIPSILLGSVTHKVVHLAECPVLIVR